MACDSVVDHNPRVDPANGNIFYRSHLQTGSGSDPAKRYAVPNLNPIAPFAVFLNDRKASGRDDNSHRAVPVGDNARTGIQPAAGGATCNGLI